MKVGIIRRVDDLGRIILPLEIRRTLRIVDGDALNISVEDGKIILEKYLPDKGYAHEIRAIASCVSEDAEDSDHKESCDRAVGLLLKAAEILQSAE